MQVAYLGGDSRKQLQVVGDKTRKGKLFLKGSYQAFSHCWKLGLHPTKELQEPVQGTDFSYLTWEVDNLGGIYALVSVGHCLSDLPRGHQFLASVGCDVH